MMEDLRTKNMIMNNNRTLSRSLSNVSFNKIQQLINYKSLRNGSRMELIPFNYPSTKMCCGCGNIKDMSLNDRVYECDNVYCVYYNRPIDRDYNSSINIRDYYFKYMSQAVA
jgi:putative transposase